MGITTPALMTFEEFEQLEDTAEDLELLQGELIRMPPPFRSHMGNRGTSVHAARSRNPF